MALGGIEVIFLKEDIIDYYSVFIIPGLMMVFGYFMSKWNVGND